MKKKMNLTLLCTLIIITAGISSCRSYAGYEFYPQTPRFSHTHPSHVMLIKNRPQRSHIDLGEVWIRPEPWMSRYYVEKKLRKKAAKMGADAVVITVDKNDRNRMSYRYYRRGTMIYPERLIVGVAIRFR